MEISMYDANIPKHGINLGLEIATCKTFKDFTTKVIGVGKDW